jgi:hypothetical protein
MKRSVRPKSPGSRDTTRGLPYLRFYHSKELRTKTLAVLDALDSADDPTEHVAALADIVLELTETGLSYYFFKPIQAAKAGFVAMQTTKVGLGAILRVMGPVARRVLRGMDQEQLVEVSGHIRELME